MNKLVLALVAIGILASCSESPYSVHWYHVQKEKIRLAKEFLETPGALCSDKAAVIMKLLESK